MRTKNSFKNILTTVLPYFIIGILGFIKVRVFVAFLKDDLYSLNQLFYQIFSYLSLIEAGFGVFISQKYYKYFSSDNQKEIKKTYATSAKVFNYIGMFIIFSSVLVSFFINFLTKANINVFYTQIIFMVFVLKNSVDFFMISPRYLIASDQKMYKINFFINSAKILEIVTEIFLVYKGVNYLIVLVPGILIRILFNLMINKRVCKMYPNVIGIKPKIYKDKIVGLKHIITQRIAGIFYSSTDIVLISSFMNPISVIIYSSYTYITKFLFDITFMVAGALNSSFASALSDSNSDKRSVFNDLDNIFILEASFLFIFLYSVLDNLITLWIGKNYLMSHHSLIILLLTLYLSITKRVFSMSINSEGYFKETKKVIFAEATINFIISILLVRLIGLKGVLLGTLMSGMLTTFWFFPVFIYKTVLNASPTPYFIKIFLNFLTVIVGSIIMKSIYIFSHNIWIFIINCFVCSLIILVYLFISNYKILNLESIYLRLKYFRRGLKNETKN